MFKSFTNKVLGVTFIIYFVGVIGHLIPDLKPLFYMLTPYNLIFTILICFWLNRPLQTKTITVAIAVFLIGFFIEVIGVKTGVLFGVYEYGSTLGWKVLDVPVVIGLNWVLLSFTSSAIASRYFKNLYLISIIAAILMVGLDYLIEPIAIKLDYWSWENDVIPFQNFAMWFLTALVIQVLINFSKLKLNSKVGLTIFLCQVMFFTLLNVLL